MAEGSGFPGHIKSTMNLRRHGRTTGKRLTFVQMLEGEIALWGQEKKKRGTRCSREVEVESLLNLPKGQDGRSGKVVKMKAIVPKNKRCKKKWMSRERKKTSKNRKDFFSCPGSSIPALSHCHFRIWT